MFYLLAMGSHLALHCYHAMIMMRGVDETINSLLHKFYMNINYIPTRLHIGNYRILATTRCTQCNRYLFRRAGSRDYITVVAPISLPLKHNG